jgi:hypothetical protein
MIKRQERIERMERIIREYRAAVSAVELLAQQLRANPNWGNEAGWRNRDARSLNENLEATYLIRLYAEFESGLRDLWRNCFRKASHPSMQILMSRVASRQYVPQDWLDEADAVRRYRNTLVHEDNDEEDEQLPFYEAKSRLSRFFSRLPEDW